MYCSNKGYPCALLTRIHLGLMINAGILLASSRRLILGGPVMINAGMLLSSSRRLILDGPMMINAGMLLASSSRLILGGPVMINAGMLFASSRRLILGGPVMINAGMLLASSRRLILGGPMIALGLTGKSLSAVKRELIKPTRRSSVSLVSETGTLLGMPSLIISAWWYTLKSAVFGLRSILTPLVGGGRWTGVQVGW